MAHFNVKHLSPSLSVSFPVIFPSVAAIAMLFYILHLVGCCSPALEHRFHESRVLSVLFSVITLPSRSRVAKKVLKELLLNRE